MGLNINKKSAVTLVSIVLTKIVIPGSSGQGEQTIDVGEHDLFGEPLSSSDEEGEQLNINVDSTDDSRSPLKKAKTSGDAKDFMTQFSHGTYFDTSQSFK